MARKRRSLAAATTVAEGKRLAKQAATAAGLEDVRKVKPDAAKPARSKLTIDVPADLALELRVACSELPPRHVPGGVSGVMARALAAELVRLRDEHNAGKPFKAHAAPKLKPGPAAKPS